MFYWDIVNSLLNNIQTIISIHLLTSYIVSGPEILYLKVIYLHRACYNFGPHFTNTKIYFSLVEFNLCVQYINVLVRLI